jgi:NADP-dependent 3-hydroxy acid dehydrogenase YdfG
VALHSAEYYGSGILGSVFLDTPAAFDREKSSRPSWKGTTEALLTFLANSERK